MILLAGAGCQEVAPAGELGPAPGLVILTSQLPVATVGAAYSAPIEAAGPMGPAYEWTASADVPAGLSLTSDGLSATLRGTPSTVGEFTFSVRIAGGGLSAVRTLTLVVGEVDRLRIVTDTLPAVTFDEPADLIVEAAGGTGRAYRWSVDRLPAGLTLRTEGTPATRLSGTPAEVGRFEAEFRVEDSSGAFAMKRLVVEVVMPANPLEIVTTSLPPAPFAEPYQEALVARGGAPPYTWRLSSGQWPAGVALTPAGEIFGRPQQGGTFEVEVEVSDQLGQRVARMFTLSVVTDMPLEIVTDFLPSGTEGVPYEAQITAQGGGGAYTFTALDPLPPGLMLESGTPSATLRGTPQRAAIHQFVVQVQDQASNTAMKTITLRIDDRALEIVTTSLPNGLETITYDAPIEAAGGTGAYTWSIVGAAPPGLSIEAAGTPETRLFGVPTRAGTYAVQVRVEDLGGGVATKTIALVVDPPPAELTMLTTTLDRGRECFGYHFEIQAVGGTPPYAWSVASGTLPADVSLDATSSNLAYLSGATRNPGSTTFTLRVRDGANDVVQRAFTLEVDAVEGAPKWLLVEGLISGPTDELYAVDVCGRTPTTMSTVSWPTVPSIFAAPQRPVLSPDRTRAIASTPLIPNCQLCPPDARPIVFDLGPNGPGPATILPPMFSLGLPRDMKWSPDGNDISLLVPQATNVNEADLYVVPPAGPPIRLNPNATAVPENAYEWSPSSTHVAFKANGDLWVTPVPATAPRRMAYSGSIAAFTWAGGGLVFQDADAPHEVHFARIVGGQPQPPVRVNPALPPFAELEFGKFGVSPDGNKVYFVADIIRDDSQDVYVASLAGGVVGTPVPLNLPRPRQRTIEGVEWSPDGSRLLIFGDLDRTEDFEVFVVTFSGTNPSPPVQLNPALPAERDVHYLPGVKHFGGNEFVGFIADPTRADQLELFVVDLTLPQPWRATKVSPTGGTRENGVVTFRFALEGAQLTFVADIAIANRFDVYAVDLRGSAPGPARVVNGPLPPGGNVSFAPIDIGWKPDGSALFYRADQTTAGANEVFMVDLAGRVPGAPALTHPPLRPGGQAFRFAGP